VAGFLPRLLGFDTGEYLLVLEDLGAAQDFTFLYAGGVLEEAAQSSLVEFLVALHSSFRAPALAGRFENGAMRRLNHEHIFALPLRAQNGLDLDAITPGLGALAEELIRDRRYCEAVAALGERYLAKQGDCLLHGDFFPGSWMQSGERVYVIDPEFCFYGLAEWDLGVMAAHFYLSGHSESRVAGLLEAYERRAPLDARLAGQFAGAEIMRRLIGVAQLPLAADLGQKAEWLALSRRLVLGSVSE
jgi:5-methylthioribose kinase